MTTSRSTYAKPREFAVTSPGSAPLLVVSGLLLVLLAGAAALVFQVDQRTSPEPILWATALSIGLVIPLLLLTVRRRSVSLDGGVLTIKAGLNTRRVSATALELERARIVDLEEHTELQPALKTFGSSLPGYQTGRFRTRKWGKGFYLLTDRRRVLWLPERSGTHVLLSLQQPQALLTALNAMARDSHAR